MNRVLTLAALMSLAACSNPQPAAENEANAAPAVAAETETPLLEGRWDVAALDGRPVDAASAMQAVFAGGKVTISSGCVRRGWTYTQKRNMVSFTSDPAGSASCEGRGTTAQQETAYAALQDANIAIFTKGGNEASLSGTGGNLTLARR